MAQTEKTSSTTAAPSKGTRRTVRDATFDVLRRRELTTIFANPGSTEIPFLVGLPKDLWFVLGLHEGAVVGIASGYALARRRPSFVLLHTTPGFGNAINAIASARANRTPMVIVVGQQDRRHLAFEPFLTGRLEGLAGSYPVWANQPVRPQDVPGAIDRAFHEASSQRGPAVVIVPMDDWSAPAPEPYDLPSPHRLVVSSGVDERAVAELVELLSASKTPAIVAGAGNDTAAGWTALVALAERLDAAVWQECFSGQAGFPQDHRLFAGQLPNNRAELRDCLAAHDLVLAVGAPLFRQYVYQPGPPVIEGTRLALVGEDREEAHRSPADLAVLGPIAGTCEAVAARIVQRPSKREPLRRPDPPAPPAPGEPLRAGHVLAALAERLPRDTVLVEESPASRPELELRIPAREPQGFVSVAMGGLGWGLNAAIGYRLARQDRPVVAVLGDGATLFGVHGLWNAQRYGAGVLVVVMKNGGYGVMDKLAEIAGGEGVWPSFEDVDLTAIARGLGCDARRIERHDELLALLDEVIPTLRDRAEPLLLEVAIQAD
jgi:benzoylformate decarboxylase